MVSVNPLFAIDWLYVAAPAAGAAAALVIFVVGYFLIRDRRKPEAPPNLQRATEPDPFTHGSTGDRRQSARRTGSPLRILLKDPSEEKTIWEGIVTDRSIGGLRIMVQNSWPVNQVINVRVVDAPPTVPWLAVQVRRCTEMPDHMYEVGCQFIRTPPWAILLTFG